MENSTMKGLKKIPIQIYLEPEQDKLVGLLSEAKGKSKAAIIRSCIAKYIESLPLEYDPALKIMNLGESKEKDIAERHDDYLSLYERNLKLET